jgi:hypothetical protein
MGWGRVLPVMMVVWATGAAAQAPWPSQQPQQQQQPAAWPGQQSQGQQSQGQQAWPGQKQAAQEPAQPQAAWPSPQQPNAGPVAPMMGMGGGGGGGMMSPMGGSPGGGGQAPPCFAEFTKLRGEFEKTGAAAKAANEKHVAREEFCKVITALSGASNRWTRYTVAKAAGCGIPAEAVKQIKAQDEHLATLKKNICSAGPVASAAPSLSEALGTDRVQLDEGEKTTIKRGGVLDSLTGPLK